MSMLEKHILPPSSPLGFELNGSIHVRPYNFFQGGGGNSKYNDDDDHWEQ